MSEEKHTPGPWGVYGHTSGDYLISFGNGSWLAKVYADEENEHQAKIDARLIAAAPEMLEALRFCLGQEISPECHEMVRAAITKAEGRS